MCREGAQATVVSSIFRSLQSPHPHFVKMVYMALPVKAGRDLRMFTYDFLHATSLLVKLEGAGRQLVLCDSQDGWTCK